MPDRFGDDFAESVRHGVRVVKMDPIPVLSVMGAVTSRLGLGATCSTTYYEPFHVARLFATLDHMTGGRAGWNVVTSLNDSEAANFGADGVAAHDERYDRADEFVEVVLAHWKAWAPDAIVLDRAGGVFADPSKVRRLDHHGRYFRSRGPVHRASVPSGPPGGHPGRAERARTGVRGALGRGDLRDLSGPGVRGARIRGDSRAGGSRPARGPDSFRIAPACYTTVGETQTIAEDKVAFVDRLSQPVDTLALLSEALNFDFATKAPDEPFTDEELRSISGLQAIRDRVIRLSGNPNPTRDDFVRYLQPGHGARDAPLRGHRRHGRRPASRSGSSAPPATASSSPPPTFRAPTRTSSASSCPSSSAVGFTTGTTRARP